MITAIGIDLGTCYTSTGFMNGNSFQIIENSSERQTLNYVAFNQNGREIGENLKAKIRMNFNKTVFNSKIFIGSHTNNNSNLSMNYPFKLIDDENKVIFQIDSNETFYPEEITSIILQKVKESAEKQLGKAIEGAVISVPSSFNDSQRQATRDAAEIAGFRYTRLINDNTAAAVAYAYDKNIEENKIVFIYNLGAYYLNLSIVCIKNGSVEVLASASYPKLGGQIFDFKMLEFILTKINAKTEVIETNRKANLFTKTIQTLLVECEKSKKNLSNSFESFIDIPLGEDKEFSLKITRKEFEDINDDLFKKTIEFSNLLLKNQGLKKDSVDEVLIIGGSSRIPKIQSLLTECFNGKSLNKTMNASESVVYGAAIQAAVIMTNQKLKSNIGLKYSEVASLEYSVIVADSNNDGLLELVIRPMDKISINQSVRLKRKLLNNNLRFILFENNTQIFSGNKLISNDDKTIELTLFANNNSIVNLKLITFHKNFNNSIYLIKTKTGCLNSKQKNKLVNDNINYIINRKVQNEKMAKKNSIESKCYELKKELDTFYEQTGNKQRDIDDYITLILQKIELNNSIDYDQEEQRLDDKKEKFKCFQEYCEASTSIDKEFDLIFEKIDSKNNSGDEERNKNIKMQIIQNQASLLKQLIAESLKIHSKYLLQLKIDIEQFSDEFEKLSSIDIDLAIKSLKQIKLEFQKVKKSIAKDEYVLEEMQKLIDSWYCKDKLFNLEFAEGLFVICKMRKNSTISKIEFLPMIEKYFADNENKYFSNMYNEYTYESLFKSLENFSLKLILE